MTHHRDSTVSRRFILKAGFAAAAVMAVGLPLGLAPVFAEEPVRGGVLKLA